MLYEVSRWQNSVFITLTFSDEYLSKFESNPNRAIRLFLDRVRKKYGKQVRHWFCAEHGEENGRLHYHGILFNTPDYGVNYEEYQKLWKYGFLWLGYCNEKTVHYIVKYITKEVTDDRELPRIISSKGIGENYLSAENVALHKGEDFLAPYLNINGNPIALPRYYYDKIFDDDDKLSLVKESMLKPKTWFVGSTEYFDEEKARRARYHRMIDNTLNGLTPKYIKPSKRRSSFERYKENLSKLNIKTEFDL